MPAGRSRSPPLRCRSQPRGDTDKPVGGCRPRKVHMVCSTRGAESETRMGNGLTSRAQIPSSRGPRPRMAGQAQPARLPAHVERHGATVWTPGTARWPRTAAVAMATNARVLDGLTLIAADRTLATIVAYLGMTASDVRRESSLRMPMHFWHVDRVHWTYSLDTYILLFIRRCRIAYA